MKAIRLHGRGEPEQLFFEDAPAPEVRAGDVLVFATGITPAELTWDATYQHADGTPRIPSIPGHEISGVVERVAPDTDDFPPGDEVYGLADFPRDGAAAEFVAVRTVNLARKPQSLAHTQAASLPLSALTAWQALFEHGHLVVGQSVFDSRRSRRSGVARSTASALARPPSSRDRIRAACGVRAELGRRRGDRLPRRAFRR